MAVVRTRFAPSPTGSLHLGNLRVAIFNYLIARKSKGAFILRIEDTDQERNLSGAIETIYEDLRWAGLEWDEGPDIGGPFEPYLQSRREEGHRAAAFKLLGEGHAYLCFCTTELLHATRDANPHAPGCPGGCRDLPPGEARRRRDEGGEAAAIRFAVPNRQVVFEDEVRGSIAWEGRDLGDFVILRADGRSTYNFAVVVDDVDMQITHVIRGSGHLSNTPKQALVFDALGVPRPCFAHLPMVLDGERRKLSKREGAPGVDVFRKEGYPPEAVVNYLSLLGWSAGDDREIYSVGDLTQAMDLGRAGASDTVFDIEKLDWVASQHIAAMSLDDLVEVLRGWIDGERFPQAAARLPENIEVIRSRLARFGAVNEHLLLLHPDPEVMEEGLRKLRDEPDAQRILRGLTEVLEEVQAWEEGALAMAVREAGKRTQVRGPALFHPVRLALCGSTSGPDMGKVLAALGPDETFARISSAVAFLSSTAFEG